MIFPSGTEEKRLAPGKVYDALKRDIVGIIREGKLKPGDRLKGLQGLSLDYDISKNSAQKAIRELVAEGVLESRGVSGTYVRAGDHHRRSIASGRNTILIVYRGNPEKRYPSSQVALGVFEELTKYDYKQRIWNYDDDLSESANQDSFFAALDSGDIAGIILRRHNPFYARRLAEFPMVFCNNIIPPSYYPNTCEVRSPAENMEIAYLVVEHLIGMGHERIGLISHDSVALHRNGYICGLADYGIDYQPDWIWQNAPVENNAKLFDLARDFLVKRKELTALYVSDDFVCPIILEAAEDVGRRVPEDLSVISLSNKGNGPFWRKKVTRVEIDQQAVGRKSAELLIKLINGDIAPGFYVNMPAELVEGETTGKLK